jgi:tetratricopeptide (TPR) repeat protein
VVTSLPIAIYGIVQHYAIDPLPWGGDVTTRVAANAGNAIFLAAYLIMAFFFTLERIYSSFSALMGGRGAGEGGEESAGHDTVTAIAGGAYLFVAMVQLLAIFWTQSRGPWLGLMAGTYLFVLLLLTALRPRNYRVLTGAWIGTGLLAATLLILMNTLPVFSGLRAVPYVGRLTQLLDRESQTGQVRTLIWEGASNMVLPHAPLIYPDGETDGVNFLRPLVGYGPEAMWVAYNKFYPPDLAHVEARNASPDRSHNETWDSLVITGLLGFIGYMAVFLSIFYWSLRWLGLLVNRRDNLLFGSLLAVFSLIFIVAFYFYDNQQVRYFGVALPAGLVLGLGVYVTLAVFLHPHARPERSELPRLLLIITVLATIVAHFVEIHFGIAIAATRTYFWIYTAVLGAVGLRWALPQTISAVQDAVESAATAALAPPAPTPEPAPAKGKKARSAPKPAARRPQRDEALPWLPATVMTDLLVFLTAVYLFTTNSRGVSGVGAILFGSITQRTINGEPVSSPAILFLLLFTWLIAAVLGLAATALRRRKLPPAGWWLRALGLHAAVVWGGWLVYGLIQASRLAPLVIPSGLSATEQLNFQLDHVAAHFAVFTWLLIFWLLAAGTAYAWAALREERVAWAGRPVFSLIVGAAAAAAVFFAVSTVNVSLVRADIIYKQGQQFDNQRNWTNSIELYRRALAARSTEDHYMLFLGRALLEQAKVVENAEGTADSVGFPEQPTLRDVLDLRPETIALLGRSDLLRAAEAVLGEAQRVNPLNTDHTANLARLYRTWSDLSAGDEAMRTAMLDRSIAEYDMAVTLSPNSAHLWNEKGNAHLARGERAEAEAAYLKSLSLDQLFEQTYLLLADFYNNSGDYAKSIDVLDQGIAALGERWGEARAAQLKSYLAVALDRTGDITGAIAAIEDVLAVQPGDLGAMRNLALLYSRAGRLDEAAAAVGQAIGQIPADRTDELAQFRQLALDIYQQLSAAQPDDYRYPLEIARLLQQDGQVDVARQFAQQALDMAPAAEKAAVDQFLQSLGAGS